MWFPAEIADNNGEILAFSVAMGSVALYLGHEKSTTRLVVTGEQAASMEVK